jgi:acyl-CoA synthetase (NDP forming)/RimJ/RimL family protein N-acetyltransferase
MSSALVRDVLLRDGSTLRLEAAAPADYDDIKNFFDGLSLESRYLRFHSYGRTDVAARAAAEAGDMDRAALIARHNGRVVAVAGFDGLREPRAAEVAFAVADDWQGRGAGTRMLEQLAEIAAGRGITRFDAEVMADNLSMLGVLESAGFGLRRAGSFGEMTVSLDITPAETVLDRVGERDHLAAVAALRPIVAPASIAVVGITGTPGSLGRAVLENIVAGGFKGVVTPVWPGGGLVCSLPAAGSLTELVAPPELVIICAAGAELLRLVAEAAAAGAKALVLLPADTQGGSPPGPADARALLELVRRAGVRMVGPGSLGVVNTAPEISLNATFSGANVRAGGLAIGSQSAALGIGLLGHAEGRHLGVSVLMALGEPADVSTNDLLEWCADDHRTAVVMLYVESFGEPGHFTRIARRVARKKPILAVKGRSGAMQAGGEAHTHTAVALRRDSAADAVLHQAGVQRFRSGEAMFDAAQFFESQPLPAGRRVGIVSNSAGMIALAADACATYGLEVREASGGPPAILGIGAGPDEYAASIRALLGDAGVDALVVCYVDHRGGDPGAILDVVSALCAGSPKPVVASVVRSDGRTPPGGRALPNYLFPQSCAAVLACAAERREWLSRPLGQAPRYPDLSRPAARAVIDSLLDRHPDGCWLTRGDAHVLLASHGIPVIRSDACAAVSEAVAAAREIGGPVVLKADFPVPTRDDDVDGIMLGLNGEPAVRAGWRELERRVRATGRDWTGAVVQPLAEPGADVLVGAFSDPDLGPVMAVASGGRRPGPADAVSFRLPPATDVEAEELIDSSAGLAARLEGVRGPAALNRIALRELILRFALLLGAVPEVAEADLDPVRCTAAGAVVLHPWLRIERPRRIERITTW